MTLNIKRLDGNFAFEIVGLNLWADLDDETFEELSKAWSTQGVLVFRRQCLSEDELLRVSARFGEPDIIVRTDWASTNTPQVLQISNMRNSEGKPIGGLGSAELGWHTDQCYMTNPATGSFLYAVELPRTGGNTYWANLQLAYDALPQKTKDRIDGLNGIFSYAKRSAGYEEESLPSEEIKKKTPDVTHPLVNTHPVTGKKALYLDPTTAAGIEGLPEAEGQALLDELNAHATRSEFVYQHDWQVGDLVMWDNGFLLHRRDELDPKQNRLLKRTTIRLSPERHIVPGHA